MGKQKGGRQGKPLSLPMKILVYGGFVLFVSLMLIIFVTGAGPYDIPQQARKMEEVLAESKRLGLPMTQADLAPNNVFPEQENAGPEVLKLANEISLEQQFPVLDDPIKGSQDREKLEQALESVKPYLDGIVAELRDKPSWQIERDYDYGPWLLLPDFATYKTVSKYLSARAVIRAENGDVTGALDDFKTNRILSIRMLEEPFIIAQLVSIAIDTIALRSGEQIMTEWADDSDRLSLLQEALESTNHRIDPRPALRGEFYMSLTAMRNLQLYGGWKSMAETSGYSDTPMPNPNELKRSGMPEGMLAKASMTAIAEEWNKVFQEIGDQKKPPRGWGQQIDARVESMEDDFKLSQMMVQVFFPVFNQMDKAIIRSDVNQDLHTALTKVLSYRAQNGHLPVSLMEAGVDALDPFNNGEPLSAILTEDEVRIWSVGRDGVDDDGLPRSMSNSARDDVAVYWPVTKRKEHAGK